MPFSDEAGGFWFNWIAEKFPTRPPVYEPDGQTEANCPGQQKPEGWIDVDTKKFVPERSLCSYEINFQQAKRNKILYFLTFYLYLSILSFPALAVPLSRFFKYGTSNGDRKMNKVDDGTSGKIRIPRFSFYEKNWTTVWVNANGDFTFNAAFLSYVGTPFPIPTPRPTPIIAPYWCDVDNRQGGDIFYRQSRLARDTNKAEREAVAMDWIVWTLIASWIDVRGWKSSVTRPKTNHLGLTFQAILAAQEDMLSYTIFNYYKLQWSRAPMHRIYLTTIGTYAQCGFDSGYGACQTIPKSRTARINTLTQDSNTRPKIPGRFVFQISSSRMAETQPETAACRSGKYKQDCTGNCQCHAANCQRFSGKCPRGTGGCLPGMRGDDCQVPCGTGYYGQNCSKTCNCAYAYAPCDKRTGVTSCPSGCRDGWSGSRCTLPCPAFKFGRNCAKTCHCYVNHVTCNTVHGGCPGNGECAPGWQRAGCQEKCNHGTFGVRCAKTCRCRNIAETTCHPATGSCDNAGGCSKGWTGSACQRRCGTGRHGYNCASKCQCKRRYPTCHHESGNCPANSGCFKGFEGRNCMTKCTNFTWGDGCKGKCHCLSRNVSCNNINGSCFTGAGGCGPGWKGRDNCQTKCDTNTTRKFGPECSLTCNCKGNTTCDRVTGKCPAESGGCVLGFAPPDCQTKCNEFGKFGDQCDKSCHCRPHTPCDHTTGHCVGGCANGWTTASDAPAGVESCQERLLNCRHGSVDGQCKIGGSEAGAMCFAGWKGDECQLRDCSALILCNIHRCEENGDDYKCICNEGYKQVGNHTCMDINECTEEVGCGIHNCTNSMGSYYCTCMNDSYENILPHFCVKKITRNAKKFKTGLPFFPEDNIAKYIALAITTTCALIWMGSALMLVKTIIMSFLRFCLTMPIILDSESESEDEDVVNAAEEFVPADAGSEADAQTEGHGGDDEDD